MIDKVKYLKKAKPNGVREETLKLIYMQGSSQKNRAD